MAAAAAGAGSGDGKNDAKAGAREYNVLIFDGNEGHDWPALFADVRLSDGGRVRVVQSSWMDTNCAFYGGSGGLYVNTAPVRESRGEVKKPQTLVVKPDLVIARNQVRGPTPASDRRNVLYGLMTAGVPAINSLASIYLDLERPLMYGELRAIEQRIGHDAFPLIAQSYYSDHRQMVIAPNHMPCVVKVSHAHAGMGKIKLENGSQFADMATVVALHQDYCTAEAFIPVAYGIRVQKIGDSYRVLKKLMTGSGWKSQFGGADLQQIPLTAKYKRWADECAKCFGGLDLLAVDALHGVDGTDHIIELNTTAIGVQPKDWIQDSLAVVKLAAAKLEACFIAKTEPAVVSLAPVPAAAAVAAATTATAAARAPAKAADDDTPLAAEMAKDAERKAAALRLRNTKFAAAGNDSAAEAAAAAAKKAADEEAAWPKRALAVAVMSVIVLILMVAHAKATGQLGF